MNVPRVKEIDWETSESIATVVGARVGECVANVLRAFLDHPDILPKDSVFVEGLYRLGGQLGLHTWIETAVSVIDPTIVRQPNYLLHERIAHYKIIVRTDDEIMRLYGSADRAPRTALRMKLSWSDPGVDELAHIVDPP